MSRRNGCENSLRLRVYMEFEVDVWKVGGDSEISDWTDPRDESSYPLDCFSTGDNTGWTSKQGGVQLEKGTIWVEEMMRAAVAYHYPCPDGAFAALAAHLYFSAAKLPVVFFPNRVYDPISVQTLATGEFDEIYLLDFVGPSGFVTELSSKVKSITILDHHKTAREMFSKTDSLGENVNKVIDMDRSGATIAYDFFREKLLGLQNSCNSIDKSNRWPWGDLIKESEADRISLLFKLIEDGDLWKWVLPGSKAFSSGLKDLNIEFNVSLNPHLFNQLQSLDPKLVIKQGHDTLQRKQKLIDEVLEKSYEISLGNGQFGNCLAVDADNISELRSELGHQLANKSKKLNLRGIGAIAYKVPEINNNDMLKISLRSVDSEDTTIISQAYGGGGHRNASSFLVKSAQLEAWKRDSIRELR